VAESEKKKEEETEEMFTCSTCGKKCTLEDYFVDKISLEEFYISGMCQECQDSVF
jgi:hypothetical protein